MPYNRTPETRARMSMAQKARYRRDKIVAAGAVAVAVPKSSPVSTKKSKKLINEPVKINHTPRLRLQGKVEYLCYQCGAISTNHFTWRTYSIQCPYCRRLVIAPGFRLLIPEKGQDLPPPEDMTFPSAEVARVLRLPYSAHSIE